MRILHVIHYYHEGFGYQENWLAAHQIKMGHEVRVLTSDHYFPFPNYDHTMRPKLGARHVGPGTFYDGDVQIIRKASRAQNIGPAGVIWFSIQDEVKAFEPDIVHLHGATSPLFFSLIKLRETLGFKLFVDSHQDSKVEGNSESSVYKVYYKMWRYFLHRRQLKRHVARYLPITVGAQDWLQTKLRLSTEEMTINPLGVDLDSMSFNQSERESFRSRHRIEDDITVIVNAGKQYPGKRIDWVIEVARATEQKGAPIALILVGHADADYEAQIEQSLATLKGPIIRLPFLDRSELRAVYAGSDVGIWPGIPSNTIQEAMAGQCALILPDDRLVGHLVDGNGLLESSDCERAADFIVSLAEDPKRKRQSQIRSARLAQRYSWSNITSDLMNIYEEFEPAMSERRSP